MSNRKRKSKLFYLHYLIYLMPVALVILGYVALIYSSGETTPFTIVTGISMQPTILPGSIAMLWHTPFDQLKIGEIIVFTPPESVGGVCDSSSGPSFSSEANLPCFVIHRIVSISNDGSGQEFMTTKGDNNTASFQGIDYPIYESQYIGQVVLQFPIAGYATQPPYNEALGVILLGLFLVELFRGRESSTKKENN
jgi:signal peptidase I